jgi:hypothetical protein
VAPGGGETQGLRGTAENDREGTGKREEITVIIVGKKTCIAEVEETATRPTLPP